MLILAVDTSGRYGSVALCRGDANNFEVLGLSNLEGGTYSARMIPVIADLLQTTNFTTTDLDAFSVVDGPGSFTGLRVGLSTVKALCEVLQRPLAVVSMLEALGINYGGEGCTVTTVLDAGRSEVYAGEYDVSSRGASPGRQFIVKLGELAGQISLNSRIITTSPKAVETLRAAGLRVEQVEPVHADTIARIGLRKLLAGETADPATLDANYIRRSDAELFSLPKP
jgi:tRNA threonylcarbamoyladenosine biosynthesis protein TsaB